MTLRSCCDSYLSVANGVMTAVDYAVVKPLKAYGAIVSAGISAVEMGAAGCLRTVTGYDNIRDGVNAMRSWGTSTTFVRTQVNTIDVAPGNYPHLKRAYGERDTGEYDTSDTSHTTETQTASFGACAANAAPQFITAAKKLGGIALGTLYAVGNVCNAVGIERHGPLNILDSARGFAATANGAIGCAASLATTWISTAVHTSANIASAVLNHPVAAATAAGVTGGLYVAARGYVNASNATTWRGQLRGGLTAVAGVTLAAASAALPFMSLFRSTPTPTPAAAPQSATSGDNDHQDFLAMF